MLVTRVKSKEEMEAILPQRLSVIYCIGCAEVGFPFDNAQALVAHLEERGHEIVCERTVDYVCRPPFIEKYLELCREDIEISDAILNFSCGVGTQTVAEFCEKPVYTGCDTVKLPGYAGLRPNDLDCDRCGECVLGYTAGLCPIANCSKSLVNGPCGGAMDGKCEVDKEKDCVWLQICDRLQKAGRLDGLKQVGLFRDYAKYELRPSLNEEEPE